MLALLISPDKLRLQLFTTDRWKWYHSFVGKMPVVQAGQRLAGKIVLGLSGPKLGPKAFKLLEQMSESCLVKTGTNWGCKGGNLLSQFWTFFFLYEKDIIPGWSEVKPCKCVSGRIRERENKVLQWKSR